MTARQFSLLYFSGTGNTAYVVRQLRQRLADAGHVCQVLAADQLWARCGRAPGCRGDAAMAAERLDEFLRDSTDLILAYPTYASDIPLPLKELLPLLPEVDGVRLSVVSTCALSGADGCDLPERMLASKGYRAMIAAYVKMPNNFKLPPVNAPEIHNGSELDRFYQSASETLDEISHHLLRQEIQIEGRTIIGRLLGVAQRATEHMMHGAIVRHLFATAQCTHCRLCAMTCPMGNITFDQGYPEFGQDCCACLRCYSSCPRHAIQVTDKTRDREKYPRYRGFDGWKPPRLYQIEPQRQHVAGSV